MLGWGEDLTILSCVWGVRKRLNTLGCCKNRKILFMTEYHFLSLSPKAVHWFLQLRSRRCYLLNGSVSVADSGSFFPFVSHAQSFWSLQSPFWVAAGQGGLQVSLQPQVYQGWLPNLAPAQSGTSLFRRALMGAPSPLLCAASWECSCSLQQSMWIFFFFVSLEECAWINMVQEKTSMGKFRTIPSIFMKIIHCISWICLASVLRAV